MGCSASKVDAHDADEVDVKSRDFNAAAAAEEEKAPEEVVVPAKRRSSLEAIKEAVTSIFDKGPSPSKGSGNAPVFLAWLGLAGVVVADKSFSLFKLLKYLITVAPFSLWAAKGDIAQSIYAVLCTIASYVFAVFRHILAPLLVILGGLWINRKFLIKQASKFLKKKGVNLKELSIDADVDLKQKHLLRRLVAPEVVRPRLLGARVVVHRVVAVVPALGPPGDVGLVGRQRRLREVVAPVDAQPGARDLDPGVHMRVEAFESVGRHFGEDEAEVGDAALRE